MDYKDNTTKYLSPELYVITCSVEGGFALSNEVEAPDFENENEI